MRNIQNEKIRYGANIIFCFFSTQKIFHLGGFHDRGEGGVIITPPLTLAARKKFYFFKKREIHFVSKL